MTDRNSFDIEPTATLLQAAIYAAWKLPPIESRLEKIVGYPYIILDGAGRLPSSPEREGLELGARQLLELLATGALAAYGSPMVLTDHRITCQIPVVDSYRAEYFLFDPETGLPDAESFTEIGDRFDVTLIPPRYWDIECIHWRENFLWNHHLTEDTAEKFSNKTAAAYSYIDIKMDDLRNAFEPDERRPKAKSSESTTPKYRSAFMELMEQAVNEFGERLLSMKKEEIEVWLREKGLESDPHWGKSKIKMMATFLRPPEKQKGGNKKL
jgi:hypothetical protein